MDADGQAHLSFEARKKELDAEFRDKNDTFVSGQSRGRCVSSPLGNDSNMWLSRTVSVSSTSLDHDDKSHK